MKKLIVMAAIAFAVTACGKKETPAPAPAAPVQDLGTQVYTEKGACATCHGDQGKGDGVAGASLKPKPRNFTDAKWKYGTELPKVIASITNGTKGTSMAAYKDMLSKEEIEAVAKHVRKLGGKQ
jgi:high-affinity iron transporter